MRLFIFMLLLSFFNCETGNLKVVADLPKILNEVSGIAEDKKNKVIWMINDSGNSPTIYGLDAYGTVAKSFEIKAENRDWEDLTMDDKGNLYIGNFGNNANDSKKLSVLKINADSLASNQKEITPEVISFSYPDQKKFPPKKNERHFDCEAFFYFNNNLYLLTKSRAPKELGKTNLYKLPSTKGNYTAQYISTFNTCNANECWVTSADINTAGTKLALLTENSVFVFSNLNTANFLASKTFTRHLFYYDSQKESVAFKNDSTLYIADEYLALEGGNLYEFKIN